MGHAPWLLWLVLYAAVWAFAPPMQAFAWMGNHWIWYGSAGLVAAWSGYIDFRFFRSILKSAPARAIRDLVLQRLICWISVLAWFLGSAGWQVVATKLGL
jgi:hypothetical protein